MQVIKICVGNDWGRYYFLPLSIYATTSSTYPLLISMQSWQRWSMSCMSCLTIAQTSLNSSQIRPNDPQDPKEKFQEPCSNFQKANSHLAWDVTISAATPLHCLAMILLSNSQNLQNMEKMTLSSSLAMYTWSCVTFMRQEGWQWKEDELFYTYMPHAIIQITWLRTMGLWKWITFFWYALYK